MSLRCPRCHNSNRDIAHYCSRCGLRLEVGASGVRGAGRVTHPDPLAVPDGCVPILDAADLYFHWEAASGGTPLLGTETLSVTVFNAGYSLCDLILRIHGTDADGQDVCAVTRELAELLRGASTDIEIASYDLPAPVRGLHLELVQAEFRAPDE